MQTVVVARNNLERKIFQQWVPQLEHQPSKLVTKWLDKGHPVRWEKIDGAMLVVDTQTQQAYKIPAHLPDGFVVPTGV